MVNNVTAEHMAELREKLRDPAALAVLQKTVSLGWTTLDMVELNALLGDDVTHPARAILEPIAREGGIRGGLAYLVLAFFFGIAFLATVLQPQMSPLVFTMWGAIGGAGALLLRRAPALLK